MTGGAASETFTQTLGADTIDGGGTTNADTYVTTNSLDEAGASPASIGTVVNLGDSAITAATLIANTTGTNYISGGLTEIGAGNVGYIYSTNAATNSAVVDTVTGIENVTGSAGVDYIVGNSGNNVINGGAGADYIVGGAGADTITLGSGSDTVVLGDGTAASADTITGFSSGATASGGDVIDVTTQTSVSLDASGAQGSISTGTFTVVAAAGTGAVAHDTGDILILSGTTAQVGTATLVAAEFGAGQSFEAVTSGDNLIVLVADTQTGNTTIYEATETANATLTAGELKVIGTLSSFSSTDADALVAANFGL
jgi:Ca2+-binding RTX toxin-like protein